jgi:hypothetical protein
MQSGASPKRAYYRRAFLKQLEVLDQDRKNRSQRPGACGVLVLAWRLWVAVDTDGRPPSSRTGAMDAYQP